MAIKVFFLIFFFFKKLHSAEKSERGRIVVTENVNKLEGPFSENEKFSNENFLILTF